MYIQPDHHVIPWGKWFWVQVRTQSTVHRQLCWSQSPEFGQVSQYPSVQQEDIVFNLSQLASPLWTSGTQEGKVALVSKSSSSLLVNNCRFSLHVLRLGRTWPCQASSILQPYPNTHETCGNCFTHNHPKLNTCKLVLQTHPVLARGKYTSTLGGLWLSSSHPSMQYPSWTSLFNIYFESCNWHVGCDATFQHICTLDPAIPGNQPFCFLIYSFACLFVCLFGR